MLEKKLIEMKNTKPTDVEKNYLQKLLHDHIIVRLDIYIGSTEKHTRKCSGFMRMKRWFLAMSPMSLV